MCKEMCSQITVNKVTCDGPMREMQMLCNWNSEKGELASHQGAGHGPVEKILLVSHCTSAVRTENLYHDSMVWPWPASWASLFSLFSTHIDLLSISWTLCTFSLPPLDRVPSFLSALPRALFFHLVYFNSQFPSHLKCNFLREAFFMPQSRSASFVKNTQGLKYVPL